MKWHYIFPCMNFEGYKKFINQIIGDQKSTCITPYTYKMEPGRSVIVAVR